MEKKLLGSSKSDDQERNCTYVYCNCIQNIHPLNSIEMFQCYVWKVSYSVAFQSFSPFCLQAWVLASTCSISLKGYLKLAQYSPYDS